MVAKPHLQDAGFERAGVSLARAKRLKESTSGNAAVGKGAILAAGAVVIAVGSMVAVAGLGPAEPPAQTTIAAVQPPPAPAPAAESDTLETTAVAATPVVTEPPVPTAAEQRSEPVLAAAPAAPARPVPTCIATIDRLVDEAYSHRGAEHDWPVKRTRLQSLLQAGLNCDDARVEMRGSFEIAQSDLGSVHVMWNRDGYVLRLAVVDSATRADHPAILDDANRPVAFVVK